MSISFIPEAKENASLRGDENTGPKGKEIKVCTQKMKHCGKALMPKVVPKFELVEDFGGDILEEDENINENLDIRKISEDDLELPIALRKKPRSCTQHSIQKYLSYEALSLNY